jgi:hypothetical protein
MGGAVVGSHVPSTVSTSDDMVSRKRVIRRAMTTANPARLLFGQHLLADAAMLGT